LSSHGRVRRLIHDAESRLHSGFATDAANELALLDDASSLLVAVLGATSSLAGEVEIEADDDGVPSTQDAETVVLVALRYLAIRGVRAVRAARSVLATGYEPESRVYDRILLELIEHTNAILADSSGTTALAWMNGQRRRDVTRRIRAIGGGDLYARLCRDAHADPDPVAELISASYSVEIGPLRTRATRVALVRHAAYCRDHAVALSRAGDIALDGLEKLDARILSSWSQLAVDEPAGT
jgi:hypothetical protein